MPEQKTANAATRDPARDHRRRGAGPRGIDAVEAILSVLGMGGIVLGILVPQEGGESVGAGPQGRAARDGAGA